MRNRVYPGTRNQRESIPESTRESMTVEGTDSKSTHVFEVLVREYDQMLLAYIRCLIRDPGLVEDVFQETLITAWRRFEDFDTTRTLGAWLRGIALNTARNATRKRAADRHLFSDEVVSQVEAVLLTSRHPDDADGWNQRLASLKECLSRLPESARELIMRRYKRGENSTSIAIALERSAAAIRKELQRTRRLLAHCIENLGTAGMGESS
jgi:RNA polymerase sigma-70 factor